MYFFITRNRWKYAKSFVENVKSLYSSILTTIRSWIIVVFCGILVFIFFLICKIQFECYTRLLRPSWHCVTWLQQICTSWRISTYRILLCSIFINSMYTCMYNINQMWLFSMKIAQSKTLFPSQNKIDHRKRIWRGHTDLFLHRSICLDEGIHVVHILSQNSICKKIYALAPRRIWYLNTFWN